jgi:hypothetical protein
MASNFPSSLDSFTNPSSSDAMDSVSVPHATQHSDLNDAVEALQAKVGADSSAVASSHDYKIAQLEAASTGKILQVVSTTLSTVYSASVAGFSTTATIPGLTATITPSDATSKILVMVNVTGHSNQYGAMPIKLMRDTTHIGGGTASGSMPSMTYHSICGDAGLGGGQVGTALQISGHYLDSPATTSATTYGIQIYNFSSVSQTIAINETYAYTTASNPRSSSMITVMEVAA